MYIYYHIQKRLHSAKNSYSRLKIVLHLVNDLHRSDACVYIYIYIYEQ